MRELMPLATRTDLALLRILTVKQWLCGSGSTVPVSERSHRRTAPVSSTTWNEAWRGDMCGDPLLDRVSGRYTSASSRRPKVHTCLSGLEKSSQSPIVSSTQQRRGSFLAWSTAFRAAGFRGARTKAGGGVSSCSSA